MKLRTRLTLVMLTLSLVPLGVTTAFIVRQSTAALTEEALSYRIATADVATEAIHSMTDRAAGELRQTGATLALDGAPIDERIRSARAFLSGTRYIGVVAVYNADGALVDTLRGDDAADAPPAPPSLDAGLLGVARTEGLVRLATLRAASGTPYAPMIAPVFVGTDRRLFGYVWAPMDLRPITEGIRWVSGRRFRREENRVYVVDDALRIIAHTNPARLWESIEGVGPGAELQAGSGALRKDLAFSQDYVADGEPVVGALVPIPELGWGVVVEQPLSDAFALVSQTWRTALAVGAGSALVAVVLGLLLGRRLAAPIAALAKGTRQIAFGDFTARVEVKDTSEIGVLAKGFNTMATDLASYRTRVVEETRIRNNLSRFLSSELVERIVTEKTALKLGGERREVTVLFADVVAFTPLSEKNSPEYVVAILNELFTFLTEIVFRHGGIVDKFLGDCVMAVFGPPDPNDDHPLRAVQAAEEMLQWLEVGNSKWRQELGVDLQLGIGINTGVVIAGNIGSAKRMEYTVIGDTVNIASRLEGLAQPSQILMSRATFDRVSADFECMPLGAVALTGRDEPTEVFALVV
jgi:adenylate cyclase